MIQHDIVRVAVKLLIPLILLFALYVQFHGDFGPGGGFQAGVLVGAAVILYGIVFGLEEARRVVPPDLVRILVAGGVLLYGGVGVLGLLLGRNYLDYGVLAEDPARGQERGIFLVELGVGVTVAAAMIGIFYIFADRPRR